MGSGVGVHRPVLSQRVGDTVKQRAQQQLSACGIRKLRDKIRIQPVPGEESPTDVPPAAFGRFRVLHQIGSGSLGPVFRGEDPETAAPVAIKRFDLQIGPERRRQVAEELEALADRMPAHPAIPRVLDAGLQDNPYLVTSFVPGQPLDQALAEYGPAVAADALPRLERIADALDHAAAHGLWHGALGPKDIVVSAVDTGVTGVGIAQILERASVPAAPRRPYTAPETVESRASRPAGDQFALAALTCEWLLGRHAPWPADAPFKLPSLADVDSEALEGALRKALASSPDDRFPTCASFVAAVRRATRAAPIAMPEPAPLPFAIAQPAPALDARPAEHRVEVTPPELSIADLIFDPEPIPGSVPAVDAALVAGHASDQPTSQGGAVKWRGSLGSSAAPQLTRRIPKGALFAVLVGAVAIGVPAGYLFLGSRGDVNHSGAAPTNTSPAQAFTEAPVPPASNLSSQSPLTMTVPAATPKAAPSVVPSAPRQAAKAPAVAAVRPDTARLLVRSTPAGATVTVDGRPSGTTPVALRDLPMGTRTVIVARSGFESAERRVTLTGDRPSRSIDVTLAPLAPASAAGGTGAVRRPVARPVSATLFVETRPAGATVIIDGQPSTGVTPLTLETIPPGRHTVRIERDGYRPWTTTVNVKAGERVRVAASLVGGQGRE